MPRRRKRSSYSETTVRAVLAGSELPELDVLLELIRSLNPSRLELDPAARELRYAWKAQLQSVLLRRYGAELEVFTTSRPGIVGIRRRGVRGDGGHARVSRLDADVRAYVEEHARTVGRRT
jgi:hypothetical protein